MTNVLAALTACFALCAPPAPAPPSSLSAEPVSRREMAAAYLAFDSATSQRIAQWSDARREEISRRFDAVTMLFFAAKLDAALDQLATLTSEVVAEGDGQRAAAVRELLLRRINLDPQVVLASEEPTVSLKSPSATAATEGGARWSLMVSDQRKEKMFAQPFAARVRLGPEERVPPGSYRVEATVEGSGWTRRIGSVAVLPEPVSSITARLRERLSKIEADGVGHEQDRAACASRLALLESFARSGSSGAVGKSAAFLTDAFTLATEISRETELLGQGQSPWKGRTGDAWRTVRAIAVDVPCRVYVPRAAAGETKRALVIALHGAGGDENMFFDGYGAGQLQRLAERDGFVAVAPATAAFALTPVVFDAIVEEMERCAEIDRDRVFLVGHSMGAGAAGAIAALRADRIAAVAMIAGFGGAPTERWPPVLVVAGGLDPLFPLKRVEASVGRFRQAGARVDFLAYPHDGHTMVVTAALDEVIARLLRTSGDGSARQSKDESPESPRRP
jgi:predicted esterase